MPSNATKVLKTCPHKAPIFYIKDDSNLSMVEYVDRETVKKILGPMAEHIDVILVEDIPIGEVRIIDKK